MYCWGLALSTQRRGAVEPVLVHRGEQRVELIVTLLVHIRTRFTRGLFGRVDVVDRMAGHVQTLAERHHHRNEDAFPAIAVAAIVTAEQLGRPSVHDPRSEPQVEIGPTGQTARFVVALELLGHLIGRVGAQAGSPRNDQVVRPETLEFNQPGERLDEWILLRLHPDDRLGTLAERLANGLTTG